jgi:membrane protease subunit (stomatin/prohibitin family)
MPVIDFVKWDGDPNTLAWKFEGQELSTWTQLVVNESQEAFLVKQGVYDGPFGAGRHTLSTENIPLIRGLMGLPFGGKSPFTAEVWFVNKVVNLDIKWGTPDPIQLQDPKYQIMVPVRAFGQYGVRVTDSKRFLLKLVGTLPSFETSSLAEYFRGAFITKIKNEIAATIIQAGVSVLEISAQLDSLSNEIKKKLTEEIQEFGVELTQFNIHSINVPEEDEAVSKLKLALAKRAEMGIVGFNYQQERSFDVMQAAASNQGTASDVMGAGLGLGIGAGLGMPMGNMMGQMASQMSQTAAPASAGSNTTDKIKLLKELAELKSAGILSEDEFQAEKTKILKSS